MILFYSLLVVVNSVLSSVIKITPNQSTINSDFNNGEIVEQPIFLKLHNSSFQGSTPIVLNGSEDKVDKEIEFLLSDMERFRYRRGPSPTHHSPFEDENSEDDFNPNFDTPTHPPIYHVDFSTASVGGMRIESGEKGVSYGEYGISIILADVPVSIRLFGSKFSNHTIVRFATELKTRGDDCDDTSSTKTYTISNISLNSVSAVVEATLTASKPDEFYYICVRENDTDMPWVHQGPDSWLMVKSVERLLPFWLQTILICILLLLSGLFAGLTLGLLSLDTTSLKILANTGEEKQRKYARTILPLRSRGNYLLCSLVLGNVLVNSTLTIILDDLTTGVLAVTISTAGIVIFGEIIPQAVCSRNGLAIGAKTVWVTKFLMIVTFPLSYTISFILDKVLGEEIGIVYNREKFKELIRVTENDLEQDEVNTIRGALDLKLKNVEEIMTRLEDIFMLPIGAVLDFELLTEIRRQGYSRIPIYEQERSNIVALLFTKDLIFVDPDDKISLKTLAQYYNNPCFWINSDAKLDLVFKTFKNGQKGHMAFIQRLITTDSDKDPYCETIGLVTLEDVIEELIQAEIVDEDDLWMDNRSKKKMAHNQKQDFSKFFEIRNSQKTICISPQLALAAFQFLTAAGSLLLSAGIVEPFQTEFVSEEVLHQVLKKTVLFKVRKLPDNKTPYLYEKGKPTDCFTLVLEGRVEVMAGQEDLKFETGPFTYFGVPSMLTGIGEPLIAPDYTVQPVTDVIILRVRRNLYHAAVQATALTRARVFKDLNEQDVNLEVDSIDSVLKSMESENFFDPLYTYSNINSNNNNQLGSSEKSLSSSTLPEVARKFFQEP